MAVNAFDSKIYVDGLLNNLDSLPCLHLRSEVTDIAAELNCLTEAIELKSQGDRAGANDAMILEQVAADYNAIKKSPEYSRCFEGLTQLANELATRILGVFNTLSQTIHPEVEELKASIEKRMQELLARDNKTAAVDQSVATIQVPNYQVVVWDQLFNQLGGEDIVRQNFADITGNKLTGGSADVANLAGAVANITVQPLQIDDETYTYIRDTVSNSCSDSGSDVAICGDVIDYAIGRNGISSMILVNSVGALNSGKPYSEVIHGTEDALTTLPKAIERVKKVPFNLSPEVYDVLQANFKRLENQLIVAAYCLIVCRNALKDVLVIDENTLNGDTAGTFLQKNDAATIAKYIAVIHKDLNVPVPSTGITASQIENSKQNIEERYNQRQSTIVSHGVLVRTQYRLMAVKDVLTDFLQNVDPARVPEGIAPDDFIRGQLQLLSRKVGELDSTEDNNLEGFLYNFIINTFYPGSVVATVNQLFGSEVTKLLEIKENLETRDIQAININVAARIAADFLMNNVFCAHN